MMPLAAALDLLPPWDDGAVPQCPRLPFAVFSDDIELGGKQRLGIRCTMRSIDERYLVDLTDSDPLTRPGAELFALPRDLVELAIVLAFARALDLPGPSRALAQRIEVRLAPGSFLGVDGPARNGGAAAVAMSRVFDTVLGALAMPWPERVGAGSCSLGALVQLSSRSEVVLEALPGGEGARPGRDGQDAWPSPIVGKQMYARPGWTEAVRPDSGGGGAHKGGCGIVRTYAIAEDTEVILALDRVKNPPHGLDRAGPPSGTRFSAHADDGSAIAITPWRPAMLPAGSTLVVETCGGAGYGFPGYGDIDFDPSVLSP